MIGLATRTAVLTIVLAGATSAQVTQLVSIGTNGLPFSSGPGQPALSADGRYAAFAFDGVYVRDRANGTTWHSGGGFTLDPSISADGRYVAYSGGYGAGGVFAVDRVTGVTEVISMSSAGIPANDGSGDADISADGRFVAFDSLATNLVPNDTNGQGDVFVHDRRTGTTERISIPSTGGEGNGGSWCPAISADGRFVAFMSYATNMVPNDDNHDPDIFVRDRLLGTTELVSVGMTGQQNWDTIFHAPSISADGRFVAFEWSVCDMCGGYSIYVRDRELGVTEEVDVNSAGQVGDDSSYNPYITPDGRYVVFDSDSTNLAHPDSYGTTDVFVRDRLNHTTERVSVDSRGTPGNSSSGNFFSSPHKRMSDDGRYVAFQSFATNLVPSGGSDQGASYVRDRERHVHPLLCEPGVSGVLACPCGNPPSDRGRGCDNSVDSGGAALTIGGGEYLSSDSLYITLSEARPGAASLVLESSRPNAGGAVFGAGIRCIGGSPVLLWTTIAGDGGTVTIPDFASGDPTVHQRSAEMGDPILPMHTRWYMAIYRDPVVLGGCPASSTFNSTPTREVLWLP
jgi:Tol biopolymer transport system component